MEYHDDQYYDSGLQICNILLDLLPSESQIKDNISEYSDAGINIMPLSCYSSIILVVTAGGQ